MKVDLKFGISDVKYLVNLGVRLFDLPGKHPKRRGRISGQISAKCSDNFEFKFSVFFSETSFCSCKGGAKESRSGGENNTN